MKKFIFILFAIISITIFGCHNTVAFSPNVLPDAKVGANYYTEIIIDGSTPVAQLNYQIIPAEDLIITPFIADDGLFDYNHLKIQGIPKTQDDIIINLTGLTFGTSAPGVSFKKTYTIKVKEAK